MASHPGIARVFAATSWSTTVAEATVPSRSKNATRYFASSLS
jgi:hypothetical protein